MFVANVGNGIWSNVRADHGGIDKAGSVAVSVVEGHNKKSVATWLKVGLSKQSRQIGPEKSVGARCTGVMRVIQSIGNDYAELRQSIAGQIFGELGKIHDPGLRSRDIIQDIAVPRCAVVAAIVVRAIGPVRRGHGSPCRGVRLCVYLP